MSLNCRSMLEKWERTVHASHCELKIKRVYRRQVDMNKDRYKGGQCYGDYKIAYLCDRQSALRTVKLSSMSCVGYDHGQWLNQLIELQVSRDCN